MFESIIRHLDNEVPLDENDFAAPVTLDVGGKVVTVGELVDLEKQFGRLGRDLEFVDAGHPTVSVDLPGVDRNRLPRAVEDLDSDEVRQLAIEAIRSLPEGLAIGSMAGEVEPAALEKEIEAGTERGERFMRAVRDEAIFVQEAVRAGKVVVREKQARVRPDFDF